MFVILFPGLSQFSRPSMSVRNVWREHPPTNLSVDLGSWGTKEPSEVVASPGFFWFKASLGCISLISQYSVILSSLGGPGIPH